MSSSAPRRRWIVPLCLGSALALSACTKKGDGSTVDPVDGTKPGGTVAAVQLAPVGDPSQMLPRDTAFLVTVKGVNRIAEVFERDRLVEALGPQYTMMRAGITAALGHDLLDPAVWPAVGLDPDGPLGLSVSGVVNSRVVAFATIGDQAKLVEFLRSSAGKAKVELVEKSYGAATVFRPKGEDGSAVILRDRVVAFVLDDPTEGSKFAEQLVTMDPNVSLASDADYRKTTGGLRAADLSMFIDVQSMVEQANMKAEDRAAKPEENWAQKELVDAQKEGASPERLAQLEQQAEEERKRQERWRARAAGERALGELLVSGIDGLGLTVNVKRSGPIFDGRVLAGEEAFVRRLVSNRQGAPVLNLAMNGAPMFCVSGQAESAALIELFEAVAAAEAKDFSSVVGEIKADTGLELPADLQSLAGSSELCLNLEGKFDPSKGDPAQSLGLGVVVHMADEAKAKYLLAKVASSSSELGTRMKKKGSGYSVEVPDWRTMYAQTWGERIVLSTDPDLATRLAEGKPGSMPSKVRPSGARGAMDLPNTAASEAFDLSLGMVWFMAGQSSFGETVFSAPGMTAEEMARVPHSKKSKKARKALDKATATVEKREAKRNAIELEQFMEITDPLGIVVAAVTEDSLGFTLTGGQFLRVTSLGQVAQSLIGAAMSGGPQVGEAEQKAISDAWEKRNEADNAYRNARLEDAERATAKKNRAKPSR